MPSDAMNARMTGPSGPYDTRVIIPDLAVLPRPDAGARKLVLEGEAFATDWRIAVYATSESLDGLTQTLRPRVQAWLELIDRQMSPYKPQSDLCRFNAAAGGSFVTLPQVMMQVVRHALDIARLTDGAFDPSLLSAVEMWGFGAKLVTDEVPAEAEIRRVRDCAYDWRDLVWQADGLVRPDGVRLDLCAIAKGYAVDGLTQMLSLEPGVSAGLIEIGGELKGFGVQPDGLPWWVEVEDAEHVATTQRTVIALCGHAVATSGDLRRGFEHDGMRLSHTIDARTACPVRPEVASTTVIDRDAWRADALATALIVMGEARALEFARQEGVACLLRIRDNGAMRDVMSPALEAWL